jgi:hypothetical protein
MSTTTERLDHGSDRDPEPPRETEDRRRWRTVYRGRGVRKEVGAVVEVPLTPEQKNWLDSIAAEHGLTLTEALSRALDSARTHDDAGRA